MVSGIMAYPNNPRYTAQWHPTLTVRQSSHPRRIFEQCLLLYTFYLQGGPSWKRSWDRPQRLVSVLCSADAQSWGWHRGAAHWQGTGEEHLDPLIQQALADSPWLLSWQWELFLENSKRGIKSWHRRQHRGRHRDIVMSNNTVVG